MKKKAYFLVRRIEFGDRFDFEILCSWNRLTEEVLWVSAEIDNARALWCLEKIIYNEHYAFDGRKFLPLFKPFLFRKKEDLDYAVKIIRLYDFDKIKEYSAPRNWRQNPYEEIVNISYYQINTEYRKVIVPSKFLSSEKC